MITEKWYTITEAARELGVKPGTVDVQIRCGTIPVEQEIVIMKSGGQRTRRVIAASTLAGIRSRQGYRATARYHEGDHADPTRITVADAARLLQRSRQQVSQMARAKKWQSLDWNGFTFSRAAIESLVAQRQSN